MKKRMLAWALLVCMLATLLPVSAFAEGKAAEEPTAPAGDDVPDVPQTDPVILRSGSDEESQTVTATEDETLLTTQAETQDTTIVASGTCGAQGDNLTWTLDDAGTLTISGEGEMADFDPYGTPWSSHCSDIRSVIVASGVTSIGNGAFNRTYDIVYSAMTSVTIPDSVTRIEPGTFTGCRNLTSFRVADGNPSYSSKDGVLFDKDKTQLICCPGGKSGAYTIPESVTSISGSAFYFCKSLSSITIPPSVLNIGRYAFHNCRGLTSISIPESVMSIGDWALSYCSGLTSVTLPNSLTSIGESVFNYCSGLTSIAIHEGVMSIGKGAFSACIGLTEISLPGSLTSISDYAFSGCSGLTSFTIPSSVTSIGEGAFIGCSGLADINYGGTEAQKNTLIDNGWSTAENDALFNATWHYAVASGECGENLTWTLDDQGILTISGEGEIHYDRYWDYYDDLVTDIVICPGVTDIGDRAFDSFRRLASITLPESVSRIGRGCVEDFSTLTDIYFAGTKARRAELIQNSSISWDNNRPLLNAMWHCADETFASGVCPDTLTWTLDAEGTLTISGSGEMNVNWTLNTVPWYNLNHRITAVNMGPEITGIGPGAFYACDGLKQVTIPAGVDHINGPAFGACDSLIEILTAPGNNTYTSVDGVLYSKDMTELVCYPGGKEAEFVFPESVTSIGACAFSGCKTFTELKIPDSVTSIGNSAFSLCSTLTSISLPSHISTIANGLFYDCPALQSVVLPENVITIDGYAFSGCSSLTGITIPNGVTSIGNYAFSWCSKLTSVTIPQTVTSIGEWAFNSCSALTDVYYGGFEALKNALTGKGWATEGNDPLFNAVWHCEPLEEGWDNCGETVYWKLDTGTRTLSIEGVGDIWDMTADTIPWRDEISRVYYVEIGEGVTGIGAQTFLDAGNLRRATLPVSLERIGVSAFAGCNKLTGVVFPAGVTSIGKGAFTGCGSIKEIVFEGEPPMIAADSFTGVTATAHYPCAGWWEEDCQDYGGTLSWVMDHDWEETSYVFDYVGLTVTGNRACRLDPAHSVNETVALMVKSLIMPDESTDGEYVLEGAAFQSEDLEQQTLSFRLPALGTLSVLDLPEQLTAIEAEAFAGADCEAVLLPAGATSIGSKAFENCAKLRYVYFPAGIEIAPDAFEGCEDLLLIRTK